MTIQPVDGRTPETAPAATPPFRSHPTRHRHASRAPRRLAAALIALALGCGEAAANACVAATARGGEAFASVEAIMAEVDRTADLGVFLAGSGAVLSVARACAAVDPAYAPAERRAEAAAVRAFTLYATTCATLVDPPADRSAAWTDELRAATALDRGLFCGVGLKVVEFRLGGLERLAHVAAQRIRAAQQ